MKKHVSDEGTQTETPSTNDQGSQTDNPSTNDGSTQTDEPSTSDNGTQTDNPSTKDQGSQTETPETNDEGTQTEKPDAKDDDTDKPVTNDQGTQTNKPSDKLDENNDSTQTKPDNKPVVEDVTIKVVYVDENGQTIQSFEVMKQVGSTIGLKDMQDLDDSYVFTNFDKDVKDFVVGKDATLIVHVKKTQQVDNGIEPSDLTPQKDWVKADVKTDKVKKVSVGTNQLPKALAKEAKLPKAGSEDTAKVGMIGATMVLLGGMIGFVSRRKVHK